MVQITVTPKIAEAINLLDEADRSTRRNDGSAASEIQIPSVGDPIAHTDVLELSKRLRDLAEEDKDGVSVRIPPIYLDDLLRGSRVYIEPPPPRAEPTTEYKALMARLRREEEDRAYERMTNPLPPAETFAQRFPSSQNAHLFPTSQADIGEDDGISYSDINRQMALIANVLISIIACSVAIWMVAKYWTTPARLALSMGGSLLVGVAEVVVYTAYLGRLKTARTKGKKEVEIKEIIKTWVIGSDQEKRNEDEPVPIASHISPEKTARQRKAVKR